MFSEKFRRKSNNYDINKSYEKHIGETITESDAALIKRYIAYRQAASPDMTNRSANNLQITLINGRRFIKTPYTEMTGDSFRAGIAALKHGISEDGTPYKTNTIRGKVKFIKSFVRWLVDQDIISIKHNEIDEIKAPRPDYYSKTSNNVLTVDDINKLIAACKSNRDRAIIAMLYECGARIQEIAFLTWGDISGDQYSIEIRIDDYKTHKERLAYMTKSGYKDLVTIHKNTSSKTGDKDFVFLDNRGEGLAYDAMKRIIERAAVRAGISKTKSNPNGKKITPHLFRTSRITNMGASGYTDMAIREQMWGNQGTMMYSFYMKPGQKAIKNEILSKAGIVEAKPAQPVDLKSITCVRCGLTNGAGIKFCGNCGGPLTKEAYDNKAIAESKAADMLKNPEYLRRKLEELEALKKQIESLSIEH